MLRPIGDKIVVQLIKRDLTLSSGIVLARNDPMEAQKGRVLAVGNDVEYVKVGDAILPNWQTAQETKLDGEDFWIVTEENVVMIFDDFVEEGTEIVTEDDNKKILPKLT
jgi:chaperonin GroES